MIRMIRKIEKIPNYLQKETLTVIFGTQERSHSLHSFFHKSILYKNIEAEILQIC